MPLKLFTDMQKGNLATEAGVQWPPNADSFDRDYNPTTGESTMYMKLGDNQKFYGKNPMTVNTREPVIAQAIGMQNQNRAQQLYDAYNLTKNATPTSKAMIQNDINMRYNYQDQFEAISQQRAELYKSMGSDQSAIFTATNPDGTPVDPRVKVAQYQANLKGVGDRLSQLDTLEQTYRSEAKILGEAEYDRQQKENEKAKTALLYLKEIADQEKQYNDIEMKKQEFEFKKSEFNQKMALDKQKESRIWSGWGGKGTGKWDKDQEKFETKFADDISKEVEDMKDIGKQKEFNDAHAIIYAKYSWALNKQWYTDAQVKKIIHKSLGGK